MQKKLFIVFTLFIPCLVLYIIFFLFFNGNKSSTNLNIKQETVKQNIIRGEASLLAMDLAGVVKSSNVIALGIIGSPVKQGIYREKSSAPTIIPFVDMTLQLEKVLKGDVKKDNLLIRNEGAKATVGTMTAELNYAPTLNEGERVLIFLKRPNKESAWLLHWPKGTYAVTGFKEGVYYIKGKYARSATVDRRKDMSLAKLLQTVNRYLKSGELGKRFIYPPNTYVDWTVDSTRKTSSGSGFLNNQTSVFLEATATNHKK